MNNTNKENTLHNNNTFARGMLYIGIFLLSGLVLVWFFQGKINYRFNPNTTVQTISTDNSVEVILKRNAYNHYVSNGKINGKDVVLFVDTGATSVSIPETIANNLGLIKGRPYQVSTANGIITVYATLLKSISIGDITIHNVEASINPHNQQDILLGMSFLKNLDFAQQGATLTLRKHH